MPPVAGNPESISCTGICADKFYDELLAHMIDCGDCLDGIAPRCPIGARLQEKIQALGGLQRLRPLWY